MTATNRLNLLLSDILQNDRSRTHDNSQQSLNQTSSLIKFTEYDPYPPSSIVSSITETPYPPLRSSSSLKYPHLQRRHHHHHIRESDSENHEEKPTSSLLNSSTLDDIFRALTLECEQYLADTSTSSLSQTKTYDQLVVEPQLNIDSNDDDYENLHSTKLPLSNGISPLKTTIEVMSPEKRQLVSINVSAKTSLSPIVSSSQTYPLLSTSSTTTTMNSNNPSKICQSSEEDSIDISSSSTNRKRRRRIRKQHILSSINRLSSSDESIDTKYGKKFTVTKRSCSTDYRQQRIKSIYDNHPMPSVSSQKMPTRRIRRRDISLQQHFPISLKDYENDNSLRFPENLCSPLSVLLTSTRSNSDFVNRSQQRRSRLELDHHRHPQPLTLLDRMHQQLYRKSPSYNHNNNNIPTQRIPSHPVY